MQNLKAFKSTKEELILRENFLHVFKNNPIEDTKFLMQLSLFMNRQSLSRILFFNEIYKKILDVPGSIMEFGLYYGRDLPLLQNLRGIYEPYNYTRKVIGFDTFEGFTELDMEKDGIIGAEGDFTMMGNYDNYLRQILMYHESESPLSQIKKFEIVRGDVCETLPIYLESHPETIIALAYLDLDIYKPTKKVLELIKPYLVKGSIVGMDELNFDIFPGETQALKDVFGLNRFRLHRSPIEPLMSYFIYE